MLLSADDKVGLRAWIMKKLPEVYVFFPFSFSHILP